MTQERDYSSKELQEMSVQFDEPEHYQCLAKTTGIYKGKCDDSHWDKCVEFNQRKASREYDKYSTREYYAEQETFNMF